MTILFTEEQACLDGLTDVRISQIYTRRMMGARRKPVYLKVWDDIRML